MTGGPKKPPSPLGPSGFKPGMPASTASHPMQKVMHSIFHHPIPGQPISKPELHIKVQPGEMMMKHKLSPLKPKAKPSGGKPKTTPGAATAGKPMQMPGP